ncbi:hypothetical protein FACS189450_03130 [Spirochaetia bacterium]|nr:hypothetical protein FACS189450_03130 [Spirochaetia bacterium]
MNIEVNDLDKDPFLLNVKNGTINMVTGEFREHRQEDFITKMSNILYDPDATSTPTETFMRRSNDGISNDIARLRGMHFVTTTEAEQGRKLSESLIKQITGNDHGIWPLML